MFTNENLHKSHKKSYHFHPKMLIVLILDDENNYYIFQTVKILLFNNKINNANKTILSFNFIYLSFILSTKKGKKKPSCYKPYILQCLINILCEL